MGPHLLIVFGTLHNQGGTFKLVAADLAMQMIALGKVRSPVRAIKRGVKGVSVVGSGRTRFQWWSFARVAGIVSQSAGRDSAVDCGPPRTTAGWERSDGPRFGDRPANAGRDRRNWLFARGFADHFHELAYRALVIPSRP